MCVCVCVRARARAHACVCVVKRQEFTGPNQGQSRTGVVWAEHKPRGCDWREERRAGTAKQYCVPGPSCHLRGETEHLWSGVSERGPWAPFPTLPEGDSHSLLVPFFFFIYEWGHGGEV